LPPINFLTCSGVFAALELHARRLLRRTRRFSMSALGHSRPIHSASGPSFVHCYSNSGQTRVRLECPL